MGLKTNGYVSKSTGIYLPNAYAVLRSLVVEADSNARAVFTIQTDRENAYKYKAIDTVEVRFKWDRKTDPAKMAYESAKTQTIDIEEWNPKTESYDKGVRYGTLYGWENDIV